MRIISYSQNFEDIMLWRALGHIDHGFYIDVGANDPVEDSVTKLFYDHGWSGINIEPLMQHINDLNAQRTRDINLACAAGSHSGEMELLEVDFRGGATLDPKTIDKYKLKGSGANSHRVPITTLKSILNMYNPPHIHFLKIDVEGFEKNVLKGMDFVNFRPWILLIEATKPNTQETNYHHWEPLVLSSNYSFAYYDGLNRFYVANEKRELLKALSYPPNVFDKFIRAEQYNFELRAYDSEIKTAEAEAKTVEAEVKIAEAEVKIAEAEVKIAEAEAKNFLAWMLFKPRTPTRRLVKAILMRLKYKVAHFPKLQLMACALLKPFPKLKARLQRIGKEDTFFSNSAGTQIIKDPKNLSPNAKQVYTHIKQAIVNQKKKN